MHNPVNCPPTEHKTNKFIQGVISIHNKNDQVVFCVVVEDEPLAQQILENYINRIDNLRLVAKCERLQEVFDILALNEVDVVFLDLDLNSVSGVNIIDNMKKGVRRYYIVITSASPPKDLDISKIFDSEEVIFVDYLRKPFSFDVFKNAIQKLDNIRQAYTR
jgi:response regulator of citrate/malate metabolism